MVCDYILIRNLWSSIYWCLEPCYNVEVFGILTNERSYVSLSINSEVSIEKQMGQCFRIGDTIRTT